MTCHNCNGEMVGFNCNCNQAWFECLSCSIKGAAVNYHPNEHALAVKCAMVQWEMMQQFVLRCGGFE